MSENITREEYVSHKQNCSRSFEDIFKQLNKMERAMFGEEELKQKGVLEMTAEMYQTIMYAKGGERIFITLVKIAGTIITITGAFWAVIELFKRIKIN
jgi:hypothetical protein